MPNIRKERVANIMNKNIKMGGKMTLGVIKHWNGLPREMAYPCLEQHDLPYEMDITLKLFLL